MKMLFICKPLDMDWRIAEEIKLMQPCTVIDALFIDRKDKIEMDYIEKGKNFNNYYDYTEFCEKNDYVNVKDIDNKLSSIEKKYSLNLNEALFADRVLLVEKYKQQRYMLYAMVSIAEQLVGKYDVIMGELSSAIDIIFYQMAQFFNKKYVYWENGRMAGKMAFGNILGERLGLRKLYEAYKNNAYSDEENKCYDNFLATYIQPDFMKFVDRSKLKNIIAPKTPGKNTKLSLKYYYYSYETDLKYGTHRNARLLARLTPRINKARTILKYNKIINSYDKINEQDKYYLCPLHYQPEAATLTFAQMYCNQVAFVENLSKCVPAGTWLYVKEHPSMFVDRKPSDYKALRSIPNVKLIAPGENVRALIKGSLGVVVLTNTTGFEGILYDKPVFVFGNVFYAAYDYVYKCKTFDDFRKYTRNALLNWETKTKERTLNRKAFILAVIKSLYDGNVNPTIYDSSVLSKENMHTVAKSILTVAMLKD